MAAPDLKTSIGDLRVLLDDAKNIEKRQIKDLLVDNDIKATRADLFVKFAKDSPVLASGNKISASKLIEIFKKHALNDNPELVTIPSSTAAEAKQLHDAIKVIFTSLEAEVGIEELKKPHRYQAIGKVLHDVREVGDTSALNEELKFAAKFSDKAKALPDDLKLGAAKAKFTADIKNIEDKAAIFEHKLLTMPLADIKSAPAQNTVIENLVNDVEKAANDAKDNFKREIGQPVFATLAIDSKEIKALFDAKRTPPPLDDKFKAAGQAYGFVKPSAGGEDHIAALAAAGMVKQIQKLEDDKKLVHYSPETLATIATLAGKAALSAAADIAAAEAKGKAITDDQKKSIVYEAINAAIVALTTNIDATAAAAGALTATVVEAHVQNSANINIALDAAKANVVTNIATLPITDWDAKALADEKAFFNILNAAKHKATAELEAENKKIDEALNVKNILSPVAPKIAEQQKEYKKIGEYIRAGKPNENDELDVLGAKPIDTKNFGTTAEHDVPGYEKAKINVSIDDKTKKAIISFNLSPERFYTSKEEKLKIIEQALLHHRDDKVIFQNLKDPKSLLLYIEQAKKMGLKKEFDISKIGAKMKRKLGEGGARELGITVAQYNLEVTRKLKADEDRAQAFRPGI